MKSKLIVLLVSCALATSGWAGQRHARKGNEESIGVGSGAAIGAMAGGPVGLILGAAFGGWLGDRFHHERGARIEADQRSAEADAKAKTLETRLAASEQSAAQTGAALAEERTQHRRDLEEALSVEVLFRTEDSVVTAATEERLAKLVALDRAVRRCRHSPRGSHRRARHRDSYNAALSQSRADAVRDALVRAGMPAERIIVNAAGEADSQATEQDTDGMALDRRVQMSVVGLDDASRVAQQGASVAAARSPRGRGLLPWSGAATFGHPSFARLLIEGTAPGAVAAAALGAAASRRSSAHRHGRERNAPEPPAVSSAGTGCSADSLTTTPAIRDTLAPQRRRGRQAVAQRAEVAAHDEQRGCAERGEPVEHGVARVERHHHAADAFDQRDVRVARARQKSTSASNGTVRCSRAAAMSGDSGAANRHGLTASRCAFVERQPLRAQQRPVSLPAALSIVKPEATGFSARTR